MDIVGHPWSFWISASSFLCKGRAVSVALVFESQLHLGGICEYERADGKLE